MATDAGLGVAMKAAMQWAFLVLVGTMLVVGFVRAWDAERPYRVPDASARIKAMGGR